MKYFELKLYSSVFFILCLSQFLPAPCQAQPEITRKQQGKLFIIGGGKRTPEMLNKLVEASGLLQGGYGIVLPMASEEPDSACYFITSQFIQRGIHSLFCMDLKESRTVSVSVLDSLEKAKLIYIAGGEQSRFMKIILNTPVHQSILKAYSNGSVIAGTSAGAAVMGKKMITGNEKKYPEYTGEYRTIEADNIEITEGLGLLEHVITDQHFIRRMRMNRLIAAVIENPKETCMGIDESTAVLIEGKKATVLGNSQVIVLKNPGRDRKDKNGLLGAEKLELSVYLPGESFIIQ